MKKFEKKNIEFLTTRHACLISWMLAHNWKKYFCEIVLRRKNNEKVPEMRNKLRKIQIATFREESIRADSVWLCKYYYLSQKKMNILHSTQIFWGFKTNQFCITTTVDFFLWTIHIHLHKRIHISCLRNPGTKSFGKK